jgi:fumarate hydratase subunit alpha
MKIIPAKKIENVVAQLAIAANLSLRKDVLAALKQSYLRETNPRAKRILKAIIDNAAYARKEKLAICQDTGYPIVFLEVGQDVFIKGALNAAVNRGVELGYRKASLRKSIVKDPLLRGVSGFLPCLIHTDIVPGDKLKITVFPKGFGCENKSQLRMFKPTANIEEVKDFIVDAVRSAGPDACPPYVIGVGIGATADFACFLAKKALLKPVRRNLSKLERDLLNKINKLNIGPMGLSGKTTALAVNVETHPTHIAGLPVAVNISCHALRSASKII